MEVIQSSNTEMKAGMFRSEKGWCIQIICVGLILENTHLWWIKYPC